MEDLNLIARKLVAPGKGILAADESTPTITQRFEKIDVQSTEESRRSYRQLLFSATGLGKYISGVILFDETIRQKTKDRTPFVEVLKREDVIPGIKVDQGAKALAHFPEEKITEGLDGLRERLATYYQLGARFTKWRAVIGVTKERPTVACVMANAQALARFAALSQEAGMVPIVEPEILMDGNHGIERCEEVTESTLRVVFNQLALQRVKFEGMLLKSNMVVPGEDCPVKSSSEEIAEATLHCMRRSVPAAVPGIVFLSGGLSELRATQYLNEMNRIGGVPWQLSFSFGRALQAAALKAWHGRDVSAGQEAFLHRAQCNSAARSGDYSEEMERRR